MIKRQRVTPDPAAFTLSASQQDLKYSVGFPQGLLRRLALRLYTTSYSAGGGTYVTDGEKKILKSITVGSDLHGPVFREIDGIGLYRIMSMLLGKTSPVTTPGSSFSCLWNIPFGNIGTLRHPSKRLNDSVLVNIGANPYVTGKIGTLTDVVTGGSPAITLAAALHAEYEAEFMPAQYNPDAPEKSGDLPHLQLEVSRINQGSLVTSGFNEQQLLKGQDRRPLWLFWSERDQNDGEVSDIFTANTTQFNLRHGSDDVAFQVKLTDLDAMMADFFDLSSLPAGWHAWPIYQDGKLSDSRVLDAATEFKAALDAVATSSNRSIAWYMVNGIPVRKGAGYFDQTGR